jgi:hypothetical protein
MVRCGVIWCGVIVSQMCEKCLKELIELKSKKENSICVPVVEIETTVTSSIGIRIEGKKWNNDHPA